jgi:hypothetical protein
MGTKHMLGVDNYIPLMQQNFEVRIYDNNDNDGDRYECLTLSTDSVDAITEEQDEVVVHYGNGIIKFPNKVNYGNVNWTLNCYCEPNVLESLREWRRLIYDPSTEKMGLPSEYMRQVYFIKYDGRGNPRDVIKCPGTWIKGLDNGSMAQDGDIVKVSVEFVISRAIYLNPNADGRNIE